MLFIKINFQLNYFLIKENNIKIAKNPAKPEPAKEPSTLVTFSITVTPNIAPEIAKTTTIAILSNMKEV